MFEVVESHAHEIWVSTKDLRAFNERFPADRELKKAYSSSMIFAKDLKSHYITARAMKQILQRSRDDTFKTEILKFLDWFDRNVVQVTQNKRTNKQLDGANEHRTHHEQKMAIGPLPGQLAAPQLDEPTTPLTPEERWALEQSEPGIRRVYHHEARHIRTTWPDWIREQLNRGRKYIWSFLTGNRNLFLTFGFAFLLAMIPIEILSLLLPEGLDWTIHYQRVLWVNVLVLPVSLACAAWYLVSLSRSTWRHSKKMGGRVWAPIFYLTVVWFTPDIAMGNFDRALAENWWDMVRGNYQPVQVYADPYLGRIVMKGPIEFGSSEALRSVLEKNPKFTLVELESPGGYVIEGMRMAKLLSEHKMDTVAFDVCASSCTVIYAAGNDRYLGNRAWMGFHRSGTKYGPVGDGWNSSDHQIANYWLDRGVKEDFVRRALKPSIRNIWQAPHQDLYGAGFSTASWTDRKAGY